MLPRRSFLTLPRAIPPVEARHGVRRPAALQAAGHLVSVDPPNRYVPSLARMLRISWRTRRLLHVCRAIAERCATSRPQERPWLRRGHRRPTVDALLVHRVHPVLMNARGQLRPASSVGLCAGVAGRSGTAALVGRSWHTWSRATRRVLPRPRSVGARRAIAADGADIDRAASRPRERFSPDGRPTPYGWIAATQLRNLNRTFRCHAPSRGAR